MIFPSSIKYSISSVVITFFLISERTTEPYPFKLCFSLTYFALSASILFPCSSITTTEPTAFKVFFFDLYLQILQIYLYFQKMLIWGIKTWIKLSRIKIYFWLTCINPIDPKTPIIIIGIQTDKYIGNFPVSPSAFEKSLK